MARKLRLRACALDDGPYSALTKMFTKLNAELPALHGSGSP